MESLMHKSFVVMLFVCVSVKYASSIECYECESEYADSACGKKVYASMIRTCPADKTWCVSMQFNHYGAIHVQRACVNIYDDEDKMFEDDRKDIGIQASITMCNTDLCNAVGDNLPTKTILIISAMFLAYFYNIGH